MKLLSPLQTKGVKQNVQATAQKKLIALDQEIAEKTKKLNQIKDNYDPEKDKILEEFRAFEEEIRGRAKALENEIVILEQRKERAMQPAKDLFQEADARNNQSKEFEKELIAKELDLDHRVVEQLELWKQLKEFEVKLVKIQEETAKRDEESNQREENTRLAAQELQNSIVQFRLEVSKTQARLDLKEQELNQGIEANKVVKENQDKRHDELKKKDREIADKYATLERAIAEFNKKNGSSKIR